MPRELDFSKGRRGPVLASPGKTRITIWIDDDILNAYRERADAEGRGYQTAMNEALRRSLSGAATQNEALLARLQQAIAGVLEGVKVVDAPKPRALAKRATPARKTARVQAMPRPASRRKSR